MKPVKQFLFLLIFVGLTQAANAQFLNQLKKRIIDKSTDAVIETASGKVADKAAKETAKLMDGLLSPNWEAMLGPLGNAKDIESLPARYQFDHRYSLKMMAEGNEFLIDYYLNKNEPYMGASMNLDSDIFIIFDEGNKAMVTSLNGKSFATALTYDVDTDEDYEKYYEGYKITNLPNKKFLGYDCIGRLIENDKHAVTVYLAPKVGAGFGNVFKTNNAKLPPEIKKHSKQFEDGLMMYMKMEDKVDKKAGMATIECVAYEKTDKSINIR